MKGDLVTDPVRSRTFSLGQLGPALRAVVLATLVAGVAYPLLVLGVARVVAPGRADGSLVERDGVVVGSSLVGQSFAGRPDYFWGRPSAAGDGYDAAASGASNLALDNPDLVRTVRERRADVAEADGTRPGDVAPDALLASASGLDPHISVEYAAQQVARVARERDLTPAVVRRLVAEHTQGRSLGVLGEPRVNVLEVNLALDGAAD